MPYINKFQRQNFLTSLKDRTIITQSCFSVFVIVRKFPRNMKILGGRKIWNVFTVIESTTEPDHSLFNPGTTFTVEINTYTHTHFKNTHTRSIVLHSRRCRILPILFLPISLPSCVTHRKRSRGQNSALNQIQDFAFLPENWKCPVASQRADDAYIAA